MNALTRNVSLRLGLLAALALVMAVNRPAEVRAAAPASLDIVPDDAAFYSAMLRNREQFDAIANSKAWAKVQALPFYQMGLGLYQMQAANPGSPAGYLQAALNNPESKKSLDFLADIFSDEIFVYGGPSFNKFIEHLSGGQLERTNVERDRRNGSRQAGKCAAQGGRDASPRPRTSPGQPRR